LEESVLSAIDGSIMYKSMFRKFIVNWVWISVTCWLF